MEPVVTATRSICLSSGNIGEARSASWLSWRISSLRSLGRWALFWTGALPLYHRLLNRQALTVVAFHRVLRRNDPRWKSALSPWTLDDDTFDRCLAFFKRHYNLVTLEDVKASIDGQRPLPSKSLLVTFDDGFADNFDYALPLLQKHRVPATIFVSSDVIGRAEQLWTEDLLWSFAAGRAGQRDLERLYRVLMGESANPKDPTLIWDIVRRGPELDETLVQKALSALEICVERIRRPRQMLTEDEIANLVSQGVAIGAHGKTHTALCFCSDLAAELSAPRERLKAIIASHGQSSVYALSFPHGAYNSEIVDRALASGYSLLFTGEATLCVLKDGFLQGPLVGRIDVDGRQIAPAGRFRPDALAKRLFTAPRRREEPRSPAGSGDQTGSPAFDPPLPRTVPPRGPLEPSHSKPNTRLVPS